MVRHEAAEALGGIASDGVDADERDGEALKLPEGGVLAILREWAVKVDAPLVVRESCQVAIDMWEVSGSQSSGFHISQRLHAETNPQYENSADQFNPMDSLVEKSNLTGMERSAAAAIAAASASGVAA